MKHPRAADDAGYAAARDVKKQRKGFAVGPAHLPDGIHKRKVQQITRGLIQNAKIRKEYAKAKQREQAANADAPSADPNLIHPVADEDEGRPDGRGERGKYSETPRPAPEPAFDVDQAEHKETQEDSERQRHDRTSAAGRPRRPKPAPFNKETRIAEERRNELETRRQAKAEASTQRQEKLEERERFRRAMAKARTGGKNGQRKLGRESNVLLERVKKMMEQ